MLAIVLVALAALPLTIFLLGLRDARMALESRALTMALVDRLLSHLAEAQAPGEPRALTERRIGLAEEELRQKASVAHARVAAQSNPSDPFVDD